MSRKIIILNNALQDAGAMSVNYVYWLTTPVNLIKANAAGTTMVSDASISEMASIQAGSTQEQYYTASLPSTITPGGVANYLIDRYNQAQAFLNTAGSIKQYTLTYWDGTAWFNLPA